MRKKWILALGLGIVIIVILPWGILNWQRTQVNTEDLQIRVCLADGTIETMLLEEYLVGVVAAEMPAEFAAEALKSQAVAARTYAVKRIKQAEETNQEYDVDTTVQTQAWMSNTQMRNKWGLFSYWRYRTKIQNAVQDTRAMVLIANGTYIDALYHSSSGRKPTERSEEVWSASRSYLINVSSGEETPLRFVKKTSFTPAEICQKLSIQTVPNYFKANDFQILSRTNAGRAKTVYVLGKTYKAAQVRLALGLASTDWEWTVKSDGIIITTYGNGHAVGLSQYGANGMAQNGTGFQDILYHFYPGTKIALLNKG